MNTLGMRRPRFDWYTLRRGWEKVREWSLWNKAAPRLPENLRVVSPWMAPGMGSSFARRLNRWLLLRALRPIVAQSAGPVVAITTVPIVADLLGSLGVDRWVYYCVDDFTSWPGLDQAAIALMERDLIARADTLIAVSEPLRERLARQGRGSHLLPHGIDLAHWRRTDCEPEVERRLQGLARPLVVFWGVIDRRMDVAMVHRLAADLPQGTILLAGPQDKPDPALLHPARVVWIPPLPYQWLPSLAAEAAVLIMPYADLPVTRAMQPLKLNEYLAAPRPVVVRDLPASRRWADALDLAASAEEFSRAVRLRIGTGLPSAQAEARRRLERFSWDIQAREFESLAIGSGADYVR